MRALRRFFRRLSSWATSQEDEERLRAEIDDHLARQTAEYIRGGLSPIEARRQAVLKFGGVEAMKESYRDVRGLPLLETLTQETRYALRRLRMAPIFTIATTLTLALGIGATTSIFTLVHAVLLKSLPVANPGELYRLGREARCCYFGGYSRTGGLSAVESAVWCPSLGQPGSRPKLSRRVRLWQLLHHVWHYGVCRTRVYRKRRSTWRAAGRRHELSIVGAKVSIGSIRHRQHLQLE